MDKKPSAPSKPSAHKEQLLKTGMRLFFERGYHGTPVDVLLAESGVPKGSFYHHFGSKEAFGVAVVTEYYNFQMLTLDSWISRDELNALQKILGYVTALSNMFKRSGYKSACLIGKFSLELGPSSESFRILLADMFLAWKKKVEILVSDGQHDLLITRSLSADRLAEAILVTIQGGLALSLVFQSGQTLQNGVASLERLLTEENK